MNSRQAGASHAAKNGFRWVFHVMGREDDDGADASITALASVVSAFFSVSG